MNGPSRNLEGKVLLTDQIKAARRKEFADVKEHEVGLYSRGDAIREKRRMKAEAMALKERWAQEEADYQEAIKDPYSEAVQQRNRKNKLQSTCVLPMNVVNWTASQRGDVDLMRHALDKGASATTRYPFGHTALHRAAQGGHTRMCKHLIMNGANARARNAAGCMPEHYARESNRLECESMLRSMASGKFLLVNGADGEPRLVLEGSI
jgi:hypothetical protein